MSKFSFHISTSGLSDGHLMIKETVLNGTSASFSTGSSARTGSPVLTDREQGFRSVLSVSTKSRHDSKVFFCLATNIYGNDTKTINLIVQGE